MKKIFLTILLFTLLSGFTMSQNPITDSIKTNVTTQKRFVNVIELGVGALPNTKLTTARYGSYVNNSGNYGELKYTGAYQFNNYFALGLGLGVLASGSSGIYFPLSLELKNTLIKKHIAPTIGVNVGYALHPLTRLSNTNNFKIFAGSTIGVRVATHKHYAYLFNIGVRLQPTSITSFDYTNYYYNRTYIAPFITFSTGFSF